MDKKKQSHLLPEIMIDMIGSHFLEAASYLREIQDEMPDQFVPVVKQLGIGLRKGYALAQIDRAFHDRGIDRDRLRMVGWTKLAMLAPYIDDDNVETLVAMAEELPAHALRLVIRGDEVDPDGKVVVFFLSAPELALFDQVMEAFGAIKAPRGWVRKEAALMKALERAAAIGP